MASDLERWREHLRLTEGDCACIEDGCTDPRDICDETIAARIALAAAEWRELFLTDRAAYTLAANRLPKGPCPALDAIMRGEGPGHNPPEQGPDGQKGCDDE